MELYFTATFSFIHTYTASTHMRRFPEPQHFFAAEWQNWDLRTPSEGPWEALLKQFLIEFQNLGLVAQGFEESEFLRKC